MSVVPKPTPFLPQAGPQQGISAATSSIAGAIQKAAANTGANFEYLLATAKVESNLNPNLKAQGSSATGLFQFIEQTWLGMMKNAGRTLGFGNYADAISQGPSGRYHVADPQLRNEILQLRRDPSANAAMAGAFTQHNAAALSQRIGRKPTDGELYMAHFFGTAGAGQLINAVRDRPQAEAASVFPAAARANRSIFYDRQGNARSVSGVYSELNRRYQVARANVVPGVAPTAVAATTPVHATTQAPVVTAAAPDDNNTTQAFAVAAPRPVVAVAAPVFRSLFHSDAADRGAVAPVVTELWGSQPAAAQQSSDAKVTVRGVDAPGEPLDLFRDARPDVRGLFRGGGRA